MENEKPTPLVIDGLVETPRILIPEELTTLARISCTEDFYGGEKHTEPDQTWRGPSLLAVLQLAQLMPEAQFVRVHAPGYTIPLALSELEGVLLAESLNGQPLTSERGAPWRLYVPRAKRSISVKWVNRLELTATRGATLEERAARAREQGRISE